MICEVTEAASEETAKKRRSMKSIINDISACYHAFVESAYIAGFSRAAVEVYVDNDKILKRMRRIIQKRGHKYQSEPQPEASVF